jgi:alpha-beta hydrolase superfamily lysophospholipase
MRFLRWLIAIVVILGLIWFIAPEEPVDREISFDASTIGPDLDGYLATAEAAFTDIVPGAAKRIVWAGAKGVKTPLAIVYLHGFSATAEEIRPVPDDVAKALGANLYFTRLAGHGRGGAAMAEATAGDWLEDTAEAIAIGRSLGDRVLVIGTSTGATLAALAATDPALTADVAGMVMISPNFRVASKAAMILDMPFARWWGPMVAGETRSFKPHNEKHAAHWTTSYPTIALFPMAALLREARAEDYAKAKMPLLVIYSPEDKVIDPTAIPPVTDAWGGPVQLEARTMEAGDDPYSHVIAGDVLSPGQNAAVVTLITDWAGKAF